MLFCGGVSPAALLAPGQTHHTHTHSTHTRLQARGHLLTLESGAGEAGSRPIPLPLWRPQAGRLAPRKPANLVEMALQTTQPALAVF